jgi:pimeloyl-ACP methyl ester carboxylesterase
VVWGREDFVLPLRHLADVHSILRQAQVALIDRCGHMPQAERPDEFLAATVPFLDRAEHAAAA